MDAAFEEAASTIKNSCMLELVTRRASREGWTEVEMRQALRGLVELRKKEFEEAARADIVNADIVAAIDRVFKKAATHDPTHGPQQWHPEKTCN